MNKTQTTESSMSRFNYDQRQNFRRALRLNPATCFADLRSLYLMCRSGQKFGLSSGYQP